MPAIGQPLNGAVRRVQHSMQDWVAPHKIEIDLLNGLMKRVGYPGTETDSAIFTISLRLKGPTRQNE